MKTPKKGAQPDILEDLADVFSRLDNANKQVLLAAARAMLSQQKK